LIHCPHCGVVPVPESELPLRLPEVESYEPTDTGESPLAAITDWVNTACPVCGGPAKRETNTMPQWAGSCWYYLRYIDPHNDQALVSKDKEKYWSPVDVYVGGAEHATRHLIYARFWHKFLYDIGAVSRPEPFSCLQHVGLIMGEDGRKMSKRWGNVVNPDEIVVKYGADALRVYEMFMGPFDQACNWNTNGLIGARKFLEKVAALAESAVFSEDNGKNGARTLLHKTIRKIGRDIESFSFNTAVSALMIMANRLTDDREKDGRLPLSANEFRSFLILLAPFAPHLAEELFAATGGTDSVFRAAWPEFDEEMARDDEVSLAIQVNGKLRATIAVSPEIAETDALALARENEAVSRWLEGKEIIKHIFVPGKLLNIVIK
jgi:leucyl-tRNA synthetase